MAEGVSLDKIKESTECEFLVSPDLKTFWNYLNKLCMLSYILNKKWINLKLNNILQ
jgi:hypothetical protein